jgi:uncharacterized membrane protein
LVYLPTDFQIKLFGGWHIPIAIIATKALFQWIIPHLAKAWPSAAPSRHIIAIACLTVAVVLPTNIYYFAWRILDLERHTYPYYLQKDEIAALHWLEANSDPQEVVLSSLTLGQYVPSVAGNKAFIAHWAQTLDFFNKRALVAAVFDQSTPDGTRAAILSTYGVHYILVSRPERELGTFDPTASRYLSEVFASPEANVYKVDSQSLHGVD